MAWDSAKPVGTDLLTNSHAQIRANWAALEATLGTAAVGTDLIENLVYDVGDIKYRMSATVTKGKWLLMDGKTLGDASSGGTARANADTVTLFTLLWTNLADADAAVSGGRGASAAADYAAHKTITIPDARGLALAGAGTNGVMLNANAVAFVRTLGHKENDQEQGHWHQVQRSDTSVTMNVNYRNDGNGTSYYTANDYAGTLVKAGTIYADASNGTPRIGAETRMANIAAYAYIKY